MVIFRVEEINAERHGCVRYRFTVQDTGIGISDEFLNRLFEPFNRSKKVSKVEGTGLGLSITKGLVGFDGRHDPSGKQAGARDKDLRWNWNLIFPLIRNNTAGMCPLRWSLVTCPAIISCW